MITIHDNILKIDTADTSLVLRINDSFVEKLYFGKKLCGMGDVSLFSSLTDDAHSSVDDCQFRDCIFSCTGDGNNREPMVILEENNGLFIHRFRYAGFELIPGELSVYGMPHARHKSQTLKIIYKTADDAFEVCQFISIYENSAALTFRTTVTANERSVKIKRLFSCQMDLSGFSGDIVTFDGAWVKERHLNRRPISVGTFSIDSKIGFSSNTHNPFIFLESKDKGIVAFNLIYSGNHKEIVEQTPFNQLRVLTGLGDYGFTYTLNAGEIFSSPEAVVLYAENVDMMTTQMHRFVLEHIIPPQFKNKPRPVLINSWEAVYFNFNRVKLLSMAKTAKKVGVELFVLDDGWFGDRANDTKGLGDWRDNPNKTGGLRSLRDEIKDIGLDFGLWVEPEMINPDSDLYRTHPEYAMRIPNIEPIKKRHQLVLDLVNTDVVTYILEQLITLIEEIQPDYIKWDCNRFLYDIYSPSIANQGEYFYRYIQNLYFILDTLSARFPQLLIESCSAGGSRFDLGMLYYTPQIWCSDNTDARDRLYIQDGTLYGYPQSCLGAHVSKSPNGRTMRATSLDDRFSVSAVGAFGYELDFTKLSKEELEQIKSQVSFYKKYRKLLQFGSYYRLGNLFDSDVGGWIMVSRDKKSAIATLVVTCKSTNWQRPKFQFSGLNPKYTYKITCSHDNKAEWIVSGTVLNAGQLDFGDIFTRKALQENSNSIATSRIVVRKI